MEGKRKMKGRKKRGRQERKRKEGKRKGEWKEKREKKGMINGAKNRKRGGEMKR